MMTPVGNSPHHRSLGRLLERAADNELVEVMTMLERARARGEIEEEIDRIRPKLAVLKPPRSATFNRLAVTPFEDMLVTEPEWRADALQVSRGRLGDILATVRAQFSSEELSEFDRRLFRLKMSDITDCCQIGKDVWPRAAKAIKRISQGGGRKEAGQANLEQYQSVNRLLAIADLTCPLADLLPPRPMGDLKPYQISAVRSMLAACEMRSTEAFTAGIQWLVVRSFKPAVILDLLLQGQAGALTSGRQEIAHHTARQILRRQGNAIARLAKFDGKLPLKTLEIEHAAGSFLSLKERSRALILTAPDLDQIYKSLRLLIMDTLKTAVTERYAGAIEQLDQPDLSDESVEAVEADARAMQRIAVLAKACDMEQQSSRLLCDAADAAAAKLLERYGADAEPMIVVDQLRTFELVFGGEHARRLWREFARRRKKSSADAGVSPTQAMMAALSSA